MHLIVWPKRGLSHAWEDPILAAKTFEIASNACAIIEKIGLAEWFNIQANGNWGLLPGSTPFFHIHIYSRNKTSSWGKPITIPEAPGTYKNDLMPKKDSNLIIEALKDLT